MDEVEVVVAHRQRATLRVGDTFLKIDGDRVHPEVESQAMSLAPVPTPPVLWHKPSVLALAALPGAPLGKLGEATTASAAAWVATGATLRRLHEAPLPPWPGPAMAEIAAELERESAWLLEHESLPREVILRNREIARAALRPWRPRFIHGDLQIAHVFIRDDEVIGIIDWSEAACGDAMYDLATLTLGHEEHLDDLLAGYGPGADRAIISAWWSFRSLTAAPWLIAHGFDPDAPGCEFDVLRSQARS